MTGEEAIYMDIGKGYQPEPKKPYSPLNYTLIKGGRGLKNFLYEIIRHPSALIGLIITISFFLMAVFAERLSPMAIDGIDMAFRMKAPTWGAEGLSYSLGGDQLGRDILSRIIYGSRISIAVGAIATAISISIGVVLGSLAGYFRGWFDDALSRFADLLLAFPFLIFAIWAMAFIGPGFWNLIIALTFKEWVEFYRLVRGQVMSEKTREYADAAKVAGFSNWRIIFTEILPNVIHSVIVLGTLRMGTLIIMEASLSFLGLGVDPRTPSWGAMISSGREFIWNAWWISTLPGIALLLLVLGINLFGEGLRDILDPRLKID